MPDPTGHVVHAAQLSVANVELVWDLKDPMAQAAHIRSLLAVAAALVLKPGAHGALTAAHTVALSTEEKVIPATQVSH